jgi:hypothetical protein
MARLQILVAGGMGARALESIRAHGIRPILTNIMSITMQSLPM